MKVSVKLIVIFFWMTPIFLLGQSYDVKRANEFFDRFDYPEAIARYEQIQEKEKHLSFDVSRRLAVSYMKVLDYEKAEAQFKKVISWGDQSKVQAVDYYYYARMLEANGKYEESVAWMEKFMELSAFDTRALANEGYGMERIRRLQKDPEKFDIRYTQINSENDDFGPAFFGNQIVFASNRDISSPFVNRVYSWDGQPFLNLFSADLDSKGSLMGVELFQKEYKSKFHEGPACFSRDYSEVYLTRNHLNSGKKGRSEEGTNNLTIHFARCDENGIWMESEPMPFNSKEYSCGHPSLSADGRILYFSSDMPGGHGGTDIWYCLRNEDGSWSSPWNAGKMVNTAGNEQFPFVHPNGNLFFSSDGRFGLGGLDIFMSRSTAPHIFEKAVNMGAPLNGPRDDFGVILNDAMDFGYFSSNRETGAGGDNIYKFLYQPKLELEVLVIDAETRAPIDTSYVEMTASRFDDSEMMQTDSSGKVRKEVEELEYLIGATAPGYKGDTASFAPEFDGAQTFFTLVIPLEPAPTPLFYVGKVLEVDPIYFDRDKYNIRPDAALVLDSVVRIMEENPSMVLECMSHTDCRHSADYNMTLSDNRARSSVQYIIDKGIDPERIKGNGYGETMLIADCPCECEDSISDIGLKEFRDCEDEQVSHCTEEQHQLNRRTEFKIVAM
jgi:outer membrane protein OmpA-like peptidoglycan-associated protein/tetratricopeptide (TPR) repeat protein